jgi:hypothetical protein
LKQKPRDAGLFVLMFDGENRKPSTQRAKPKTFDAKSAKKKRKHAKKTEDKKLVLLS